MIHQNDAVHIVFPSDLRADVNAPGDGFYAVLDHDPLLPNDARLYGHIESVHMASRRRPASMQLEFDTLVVDGHRYPIAAIPLKPDDPHLRRGTNGRLVADYRPGDQAGYTVGGAALGLIVGGILHRPILGTFLGAFLGSAAGAENARENRDLVVSKGEKMVAVFERDLGAPVGPTPLGGPSGWHTHEGAGHHAPPAVSDRGMDIQDEGHALTFDPAHPPFWDGDELLVPLDKAAEQFQVDVTRHADGHITLEGPAGALDLQKDSDMYQSEKAGSGRMRHACVTKGDTLFVPIEVFAAVSPDHISVNGNHVEWVASQP